MSFNAEFGATHIEDQIIGLDENFLNISVAAVQAATIITFNVGSGENPGRFLGNQEKSDPGAACGF